MAYMRSALKRYGRPMSGLGDDCPSGFTADPDGNCSVTVTGPAYSNPVTPPTQTVSQLFGGSSFTPNTPAPSTSSSSSPGFFSSFLSAFKPAAPGLVPPSTGISTTTLVIAGVGIVALVMIMGKKKPASTP